jgi:vancomycin resistance protein VanW
MQTWNSLHRLARQLIPLALRQEAAQTRRVLRDWSAGIDFSQTRGGEQWPAWIELAQPVMPSALLENKLSNISRGVSLINMSLIEPGEIWSFWSRVGRPSSRNRFVEGRNLVGGRLVSQVGGGLCQLSSLIYHLALLSGLEIVERHAHSIDIYREEERFTPLGADATVVWGFKDLRLRNPHPFAVSIACVLEGMRLAGYLGCGESVPKCDISFVCEDVAPGLVRVKTLVDGTERWQTHYERLPDLYVRGTAEKQIQGDASR